MSSIDINDEGFLDDIWGEATEIGCKCNSSGYFEQHDSSEVICVKCSEVVILQNKVKELKERYKESN